MRRENNRAKVMLVGAEDEENLAIRYLAAVLKRRGHIVFIEPCSRYEHIADILKKISTGSPDILAVSIPFQSSAGLYFRLVSEIRKSNRNVHITIGGHFPTFDFENILRT